MSSHTDSIYSKGFDIIVSTGDVIKTLVTVTASSELLIEQVLPNCQKPLICNTNKNKVVYCMSGLSNLQFAENLSLHFESEGYRVYRQYPLNGEWQQLNSFLNCDRVTISTAI